MNWFKLAPDAQRHHNWILRREGPPVVLRERYNAFQCPECYKVDENIALHSGIDVDVRLRANTDFVEINDGLICASEKAQAVCEAHELRGLEFLPLPGDKRYRVMLPTHLLPVDLEKAGFEYQATWDWLGKTMPGGMCSLCHRPKGGAYIGPLKASYQLPEDPFLICAPAIDHENTRGRVYGFRVSGIVKEIFNSARLTGIGYSKLL